MKLSIHDTLKLAQKINPDIELAKNSTNPSILRGLRNNGDLPVKIEVAKNPNCDRATKISLLNAATKELLNVAIDNIDWMEVFKDDTSEIEIFINRSRVGRKYYIDRLKDPRVLEILAHSRDSSTRLEVAGNTNISLETVQLLLNDSNQSVQEAVKLNEKVELLNQYSKVDPKDIPTKIKNSLVSFTTDKDFLIKLFKSGLTIVGYRGIITNPVCPPEIFLAAIKKYPNDKEIEFELAKNPKITKEVVEILSHSETPLIQGQAISNKNMTSEILEKMVDYPNLNVGLFHRIASSPICNIKILEKILNKPNVDDEAKYVISQKSNLTPQMLTILSKTDNMNVLINVVGNQNTPENVLEEVCLKSGDESVISALTGTSIGMKVYDKIQRMLKNIETTTDQFLINKVFNEKKSLYMKHLSRNQNIPENILIYFIKNGDTDVLRNLISKNLSPKILLMLLKTRSSNVYLVLRNDIYNGAINNPEIVKICFEDKYFNSYFMENFNISSLESIKSLPAKKLLMQEYLKRNKVKLYTNEKDTHITTPHIPIRKNPSRQRSLGGEATKLSGEKLYDALLKRQELQYKYDALADYYQYQEVPSDSKLPIIQFNLAEINQTIAKYLYYIIWDWRRTRLDTRERRIKEMLQNEEILRYLKVSIVGRNINQQRKAIEMALNTVHSSGQMIEHAGLEKFKLDYLSNMDTAKWDRDLKYMSSVNKKIKISSREKNKEVK